MNTKNILIYGVSAIALGVGGWFGYKKYTENKNKSKGDVVVGGAVPPIVGGTTTSTNGGKPTGGSGTTATTPNAPLDITTMSDEQKAINLGKSIFGFEEQIRLNPTKVSTYSSLINNAKSSLRLIGYEYVSNGQVKKVATVGGVATPPTVTPPTVTPRIPPVVAPPPPTSKPATTTTTTTASASMITQAQADKMAQDILMLQLKRTKTMAEVTLMSKLIETLTKAGYKYANGKATKI